MCVRIVVAAILQTYPFGKEQNYMRAFLGKIRIYLGHINVLCPLVSWPLILRLIYREEITQMDFSFYIKG